MNISDLSKLSHCGGSLSVEEASALEVAMLQKKLDEGFSSILFWGRITGENTDYLIVYASIPGDIIDEKKFYFCTAVLSTDNTDEDEPVNSRFVLQEMPEVSEANAVKAAAIFTAFKGDPTYDPTSTGEEEEDEEEVVPDRFTELIRLSHTVRTIQMETGTVPAGAYIVGAKHNIMQNKSYAGLSDIETFSLSSYYHFRVSSGLGASVLAKKGVVKATEFFDPLAADTPSGVWSIQPNSNNTAACIRSLLWPGYFFFNTVGSPSYGGAYFGNGIKNRDVAFMLASA